jgi:hypothetical protein
MNRTDLIMTGVCALLWLAVVAPIALCRLASLHRGFTLPRIGYGYIALVQVAVLVALQPMFFGTYASTPDLLAALVVIVLLLADLPRWRHGVPCEYVTRPGDLAP